MRKFKKGQTVYYFEKTGQFEGVIVEGGIATATKDLLTGKITYTVVSKLMFMGWDVCNHTREATLTADKLYTSKKQIEKDYKEFLVYGSLSAKLDKVERLLTKIDELLEPKETQNLFAHGLTLDSTEFKNNTITINSNKIMVDGIGNLQEEFNKLKKEVNALKKKIKTPKKKPVVKKTEEDR